MKKLSVYLDDLIDITITIYEEAFKIQVIKVFYFKDPCKKCIVRACCSSWCEDSQKFYDMQGPFDSIIWEKIVSGFILATYAVILYLIITLLVKG